MAICEHGLAVEFPPSGYLPVGLDADVPALAALGLGDVGYIARRLDAMTIAAEHLAVFQGRLAGQAVRYPMVVADIAGAKLDAAVLAAALGAIKGEGADL